MKVLISPVTVEEAAAVADGGADIVDIKNPAEGSLGANFPWVIREVANALQGRDVTISATLGDLPFKPGTAALAALGAAYAGARYIKAGLFGTETSGEAAELMSAVVRTCRDFDPNITVVAAGYADYRRFNGLKPQDIVTAAAASGADVVMLDTAIKDGATLFDSLELAELRAFVDAARKAGLQVALAGSVRTSHIEQLMDLAPDIIGVRGAVCAELDRTSSIQSDRVRAFVNAVRSVTA